MNNNNNLVYMYDVLSKIDHTNNNKITEVIKKQIFTYFISLSKTNKRHYLISDIKINFLGSAKGAGNCTVQFSYYVNNKKWKFIDMAWQDQAVSIINKDILLLGTILEKITNFKVEVISNRLHYPYINAQILAQYLGHNSDSNTFVRFTKSILIKTSINSKHINAYIVGIKIAVKGRLTTERLIPRKTVKSIVIGTFSPKNLEKNIINISKGKVNLKNRLGAFTIHCEICSVIKNK